MDERDTAGVTIRLILDYVRGEAGTDGLEAMLALAGETRPLAVLENPRAWSGRDSSLRLFDAAAEVTGDPFVARQIGASAVSSIAHPMLRAMLTRFGSPRALFRALPIVVAKFDSTGTSRVLELGADHAVVAFGSSVVQEPNRHDCEYTHGLLTQASVLYGLPPAVVEETACQVDGAPECVFAVSWQAPAPSAMTSAARRLRRNVAGRLAAPPAGTRTRTVPEPPELASVYRSQLAELQQTLLELVETRDLDEVLRRVTERAGVAVAAQRLLFASRPRPEEAAHVYADGIEEPLASKLAEDALAGREPLLEIGGRRLHVIMVDVRSAERDYGKIVAFSGAPFMAEESGLLAAYGQLAATTLDTVFALEVARDRQRSAEELGNFSRRLIDVQDLVGLGRATVAAIRNVADADLAVLLVHDEADGVMRTLAHDGYPAQLSELIDGLVVQPQDTPLLSAVLRVPDEPLFFYQAEGDPYIKAMMELFDVHVAAIMAVRSGRRVFGVIAACWQSKGSKAPEMDKELFGRLGSIADQAAGSWEKTLLLEQVRHHATIDSLTGLANRRVFTELLAELVARPGKQALAVLFCDLDRFKGVNDALGHAAGDELLVEVGRRLLRCVRSDDLVARLGGDEFTVLLTDVEGRSTLDAFAAKVREEMAEPIELDGSQLVVHLSIGAVITAPGETSVKDVLRRADAAMYAAKARGGDRLLVFEPDMLRERSERVELEASLANAAHDLGQFAVLYQPQVELASRRVVGAEALVRWDHPVLGRLAPDRFLPVAEDTGFVVGMDLHVLRTALNAAAAWREAGLELVVAVNFSARTLTSADLVERVKAELDLAGMPGRLLEIELTESAAVTDAIDLGDKLLQLGQLGISIAIDDVGTGYSSLALLHRLPAQRIKIDRSFVTRITEDSASRSVVEAVLLLADRLNQGVVAEGIESAEEAAMLLSLGCQIGQGFLYSVPVEADAFALLAGAPVASPQI